MRRTSKQDTSAAHGEPLDEEEIRTLGEGVFVPRPGKVEETDGWLLNQGYDADLDQTFLEIRDAQSMELEARVWTGEHLPLGFHGNFYSAL
jgi:carotenoid cleavage dioxygenase-like enzyme